MPIYGYFRYFRYALFLLLGQLPSGNFVAFPAQRVSNFRTNQIAYCALLGEGCTISYLDSSEVRYSLSWGCHKNESVTI